MKNFSLALLILTLISCVYDVTTVRVDDYEWAVRSKLFEKGWIPKILISKQMKNIYIRSKVDTNDIYFRYTTVSADIKKIESELESVNKRSVKFPAEILKIGSAELMKLKAANNYYKITTSKDTLIITTDASHNVIYCWN